MAVGADEIAYLRHGGDISLLRDTFAPLPDEKERLQTFARIEGILMPGVTGFPTLSDNQLRVYIRQTHARRSGARVRKHFVEFPALGEALAHICEGHWHDFGVLDDPDRFHREYVVEGYTTNILALTLYLRLIDLFHLTDDRTPYALWRFISPRDKRSAEAWRKHRALHGVNVKSFHPGRAIRVQGFTEDEEVWSGLEDLRRYCEGQVRRTHELAVRHIHKRYGLDFIKVEWDVTTGKLKPIGLRFEFDRAAMFRILSDDIYDGDPYVFLRELLQNAIDAIRTRRARQSQLEKSTAKRRTSNARFDTTIYFSAEHQDNGDIRITCRDNGIGMDEHVIRNYFSVAGVSYYRSPEFERQHLSFEPVSRFGVGILSCFMVAESLEVKTYRDPACGPPIGESDVPGSEQHRARRLSVRIPGVDRQFVVTDADESMEPGTELELTVSARKLKKTPAIARYLKTHSTSEKKDEFSRVLRVTEFLGDIAGFVEFPIHIFESWPGRAEPSRTLILHPATDRVAAAQEYTDPVIVRQLTREYPWAAVTEPESLAAAADQLITESFDISALISTARYEGWLTFPVPKGKDWDFTNNDRDPNVLSSGAKFQHYDRATFQPAGSVIMWTGPQQYAELKGSAAMLFGVYRDGIRLSGLNKVAFGQSDSVFPLPALHVNLPSETAPPNLARTSLGGDSVGWDKPILNDLRKRLRDTYISDALDLQPAERLFRLGWISSVFRLSGVEMMEMVPESKTPTIWLGPPDRVEVKEDGLQIGQDIALAPDEVMDILHAALIKRFSWTGANLPTLQWNGPVSFMWNSEDQRSKPVLNGSQVGGQRAAKRLVPRHLQFLQPPTMVAELLRQTVCTSVESTISNDVTAATEGGMDARRALMSHGLVREALEIARDNPVCLTPLQRDILHKVFPFLTTRNPSVLPISFASPFNKYAVTPRGDVNLLHPFGQNICRALGAVGLAEADGKFEPRELENLHKDCMRHDFFIFNVTSRFDTAKFAERVFSTCNISEFPSGLYTAADAERK